MSADHSHPSRTTDPGDLPRKVTTTSLRAQKLAGVKIAALTAYDYPTATIAEAGGVDVVLVGDSLANTALGYDSTIPVSMDEMLIAVRAVRRALRRAILVADMPFGSYQVSDNEAIAQAVLFLKVGAEAVKLEGGEERARLVRRLVENGIPVMGHVGLTPQSVHVLGGYRVQGRGEEEAARVLDDARALEEAGAFSVVLESVPVLVAARITRELEIPTIGIGAGPECDGQILVIADVLGLGSGRRPRFARQYLDVQGLAVEAVRAYRNDILTGSFPSQAESYADRPPMRRRPDAAGKQGHR